MECCNKECVVDTYTGARTSHRLRCTVCGRGTTWFRLDNRPHEMKLEEVVLHEDEDQLSGDCVSDQPAGVEGAPPQEGG
jgi:hypothetical protein